MVANMNYNCVLLEDYVTYILDMVATRELQVCIGGRSMDLHTGQHACTRTAYVISIRGERDLCDLHTGHGNDA